MSLFLKVIFLQLWWYVSVAYGSFFSTEILIASVFFVFLNFLIFRPQISFFKYLAIALFFAFYGLLEHGVFLWLQWVKFEGESFIPWWFFGMYIIFVCYYGDIFDYLKTKKWYFLAGMGAIGGLLAFSGGAKFSNLTVLSEKYYYGIAVSWGFFFPASLRFYSRF